MPPAELTLPRAREAYIHPAKLKDYALSPDHDEGKHKARLFLSMLGIGQEDWEYLHDQIIKRVPEAGVRIIRPGPRGAQYEVPILIDGLNGATHPVLTAWMVPENDPPRLITLYPEKIVT